MDPVTRHWASGCGIPFRGNFWKQSYLTSITAACLWEQTLKYSQKQTQEKLLKTGNYMHRDLHWQYLPYSFSSFLVIAFYIPHHLKNTRELILPGTECLWFLLNWGDEITQQISWTAGEVTQRSCVFWRVRHWCSCGCTAQFLTGKFSVQAGLRNGGNKILPHYTSSAPTMPAIRTIYEWKDKAESSALVLLSCSGF